MGGITFYLFVVLTITGVLLMYYFHPSKGQAYNEQADKRSWQAMHDFFAEVFQ